MNGWRIAWQFARRELRGGVRGFRVLIIAWRSVASVAGVGSVATALKVGLKAEGRVLLGGDVDLVFTHRQASEEQLGWLRENTAAISMVTELRTMARRLDGGKQQLVELKGVDVSYPLYGGLILRDGADLSAAFYRKRWSMGRRRRSAGTQHLDLSPGGTFKIGDAEFVVTAILDREPDRGTQAFRLGPRVIVSKAATAATRLIQPGSLIRYQYRLALPPEEVLGEWRAKLDERFPGAGWRIRDVENAAPGIQRFVDRVALFLSLIGLTALLVGGVGVANAVHSFMDSRVRSIAIFKCLGATSATIFLTYALQVGLMASIGITIGLIAGVLTPVAVSPLLEGRLPVTAEFGVFIPCLYLRRRLLEFWLRPYSRSGRSDWRERSPSDFTFPLECGTLVRSPAPASLYCVSRSIAVNRCDCDCYRCPAGYGGLVYHRRDVGIRHIPVDRRCHCGGIATVAADSPTSDTFGFLEFCTDQARPQRPRFCHLGSA